MPQTLTPADLSMVERTYLGVLSTGIVPARLANDDGLRMDYITAVCLALRQGEPRDTYTLDGGPAITPAFHDSLLAAVLSLDGRGIISAGSPSPEVLASDPELVSRPAPPRVVDFDQHPRIFDRYLSQECMEELFRNPAVYPFLMGKYQDSGEVWGRLYSEGYGRFR